MHENSSSHRREDVLTKSHSPQTEQSTAFFRADSGLMNISGGIYTQIIHGSNEQGLDLLRKATSLAAMHDSSDRDPPPRCAEGTRIKVIQDILTWIEDPEPTQSVLWLNGPFGNGKSAIMQTIAETLRNDSQTSHLLAGSFFFGRGKPDRDKAGYLIPTIAYQIATNLPWMRKPIENAVTRDPTILSKSIDAQLRYLITEPFRLTPDQSHTPTVLIDGLDECEGHGFQCLILNAISSAVFKDHVKLRFVIASRPEPQIRERFVTQPLSRRHFPITLDDDYETRKELRQHLRVGFEDIFMRKCDLMFGVRSPWPSEQQLEDLAYRASGQFLYASTVLRFVDSDDTHPVHQLELILSRQPGSIAAFSSMDDLYTLILESCPRKSLPLVLSSLVFLQEYLSHTRTIANLEILSGLRADDISVVLRALPAVVAVGRAERRWLPDDYNWQEFMRYYSPTVIIHHQSFIEFLIEKERAGRFHVDKDVVDEEAVGRLDELVAECLTTCGSSLQYIHNTWVLIRYMLRNDLSLDGIQPFLRWARLRRILDEVREGRNPFPSKPSSDFFNAFWCVLGTLVDSRAPGVDEYRVACRRIFDVIYLDRMPSLMTATMWKIAGVVAPYGIDAEAEINAICKVTGLSIETVFQTLKGSQHLFSVDASSSVGWPRCFILMKSVVRMFLLDESRSKNLYFAYRRSGILWCKSKIMLMSKCNERPEFDPFSLFVDCGWDIRIDLDMQKGSPMSDFIEQLHVYFISDSYALTPHWGWGYTNKQLVWLCRQFRIIKSTSEHENIASKLQDIIDLTKDKALKISFSELRPSRLWLGFTPLPFGVNGLQVLEDITLRLGRSRLLIGLQDAQMLYREISFFWNKTSPDGISAKTHIVIVDYFIVVLLLMASRHFSEEDRKSIYATRNDVNWEYHLLKATASRTIRNSLLTIHYLFTERNDYIDRNTTLELLPLSFLNASLAWFRKYYGHQNTDDENEGDDDDEGEDDEYWDDFSENEADCDPDEDFQGEGFESWCEQAIAAKIFGIMRHGGELT